jgi:hypothetical protein
VPISGEFYEDDQPVETIMAVWEAGEKQRTRPPRRMVEATAEVPAGLDEAAVNAMLGALDDLGIGGDGSSVPAAEHQRWLEEGDRLRQLADRIIALDALTPESRRVTLTDIIGWARQARGEDTGDGD